MRCLLENYTPFRIFFFFKTLIRVEILNPNLKPSSECFLSSSKYASSSEFFHKNSHQLKNGKMYQVLQICDKNISFSGLTISILTISFLLSVPSENLQFNSDASHHVEISPTLSSGRSSKTSIFSLRVRHFFLLYFSINLNKATDLLPRIELNEDTA